MDVNQFWRINRNYFYVCGLSILAFILAYLNFLKIWENTVPYAIEVRWCHFFLIILTGQAVLYPSGLSFCWPICSQKMLSKYGHFARIYYYILLYFLKMLIKSNDPSQIHQLYPGQFQFIKGPFIYYVITCREEGGQKMPFYDYFQY